MAPREGTQRKKRVGARVGLNSQSEISLRPYRVEDFEPLWDIDQECYEPGIAYSRRELKNYLRFPGSQCVVAEGEAIGKTSRKIVGFCVTAQRGEFGYIVTIDVLREWRRRGVGTLLLEEVERHMQASGVREVSLETATVNEAGIAFWKRHGYRNRGVRESYYPGGRDAYSMVKTLA
jgi:[ribosomal protein S18]-alanine N-acetyltransferase